MLTFRAALAAVVVCLGAHAPLHAAEPLTLDDAFRRVIDTHPDLAALRYTERVLAAETERAAQSPPLTLAASAENIFGSGSAAGLEGSELTLSLSSVIERSGKREARTALAMRSQEGVELLREGRRLDLLAEVARRYLDALSARHVADLLRADLAQRQRLLEAAARRVRAGLGSASERLAAEATRLRVAAELELTLRREQHARRRLALLWGDDAADFELAAPPLTILPTVPAYDGLLRRLADTPELRRFAHEARLREARLQLARTARAADIEWQAGVRRLQAERDWGLVGSVAIPFGSARRADPGVRAAEAELSALELEREGQSRALQATLAEAWGQLDLAVATARGFDDELLPALHAAATAAETAYRAGASGYLEWAQLQTEITAARRARLEASLAAHRALIELQRLTGQTFAVAAGTDTDA